MSWLLGAKALQRHPFCPAPRRATFWEFTMQITLPKWIGFLIMLILRPGITASCAAYLMLYADGSWYHFLSGALAFKSCIETHDIYKEVRDAR
ncbi:hypothetical protein P5M41_002001 [Salmonella enterica subsp. enterica serovar Ruiru]|nr:hypothetical protein [Salmonella enterica subsp. enterica serovar Ruiru]